MRVIATLFLVIAALGFGAVGGYVYRQAEVTDLGRRVSGLEERLAEAEQAATTVVRENQSLKVELAARMKLSDDQHAKIAELQSALARAASPPPASEPAAANAPAAGAPNPPAAAPTQPPAPVIPPLPPARP